MFSFYLFICTNITDLTVLHQTTNSSNTLTPYCIQTRSFTVITVELMLVDGTDLNKKCLLNLNTAWTMGNNQCLVVLAFHTPIFFICPFESYQVDQGCPKIATQCLVVVVSMTDRSAFPFFALESTVCCVKSSLQVIWYWSRWHYIAGPVNPCVSLWDNKGYMVCLDGSGRVKTRSQYPMRWTREVAVSTTVGTISCCSHL